MYITPGNVSYMKYEFLFETNACMGKNVCYI